MNIAASILGIIGSIIGVLFNASLVTFLVNGLFSWLAMLSFLGALVAAAFSFKTPSSTGSYLIVLGLVGGLLSPGFTAIGLIAGALVVISGILVRKAEARNNDAQSEDTSIKSLLKEWWQAGKKD
jgi:predicted membrane protein